MHASMNNGLERRTEKMAQGEKKRKVLGTFELISGLSNFPEFRPCSSSVVS